MYSPISRHYWSPDQGLGYAAGALRHSLSNHPIIFNNILRCWNGFSYMCIDQFSYYHEIDSEMGGDGFDVKSRYNLPQLLLQHICKIR